MKSITKGLVIGILLSVITLIWMILSWIINSKWLHYAFAAIIIYGLWYVLRKLNIKKFLTVSVMSIITLIVCEIIKDNIYLYHELFIKIIGVNMSTGSGFGVLAIYGLIIWCIIVANIVSILSIFITSRRKS